MCGNVGDLFNELLFFCYDILYCRQLFELFRKYLHFILTVHYNSAILRNVYKHLWFNIINHNISFCSHHYKNNNKNSISG